MKALLTFAAVLLCALWATVAGSAHLRLWENDDDE
jgi:hypothetical protein